LLGQDVGEALDVEAGEGCGLAARRRAFIAPISLGSGLADETLRCSEGEIEVDAGLAVADLLALVADEALEAPEDEGDALSERFFEVVRWVDGAKDALAVFEPLVFFPDLGEDAGLGVEAELCGVVAGDRLAFGGAGTYLFGHDVRIAEGANDLQGGSGISFLRFWCSRDLVILEFEYLRPRWDRMSEGEVALGVVSCWLPAGRVSDAPPRRFDRTPDLTPRMVITPGAWGPAWRRGRRRPSR